MEDRIVLMANKSTGNNNSGQKQNKHRLRPFVNACSKKGFTKQNSDNRQGGRCAGGRQWRTSMTTTNLREEVMTTNKYAGEGNDGESAEGLDAPERNCRCCSGSSCCGSRCWIANTATTSQNLLRPITKQICGG